MDISLPRIISKEAAPGKYIRCSLFAYIRNFCSQTDMGSVDIPWGIIELVLWRTALQADVFGFIRAHLHFVPMYTGYSW